MSNYKQLIQKIIDSNDPNTLDTAKKLIYLSVNDAASFTPHCSKIAKLIGQALNSPIQDDEVKKLFLQLLSQIATNYYQHIPVVYYNFGGLVNLLSDQNAQVRKAAHYLLLIFIKKYQKIDQVLDSYLKIIQQNPDHWKVIQKIIHSFQSLLVIQPKCITYGKSNDSMDEFMQLLLALRAHQHHLIQKASDQVHCHTVTSFVKNEYAAQVIPKMDAKIMQELILYASKLNIKLSINRENANMLHVGGLKQDDELEEIKISQTAVKKSKKRLLLEQAIRKIQSESDWKVSVYFNHLQAKLQAVQLISNQLATSIESEIPEDLMDKILDLTYDYNFKTCITAMNIIWTLVTKFHNTLFEKREKAEDVIIEKICDLKMAVRQIASKILKKLYQQINTKSLNKKILVKLSCCSIVGKQQILNFLQQNYKSNQANDLSTVLSEVSQQLMNENTRIKIKTIDCLVKLSVSNDLEECKYILQKKLNKVYYDMFLERLREKVNVEGQMGKELVTGNDKNYYNKGNMTWQAERSSLPVETIDKQSLTKVQFGSRKPQKPINNNNNMIDTMDDFSYENSSKKLQTFNEKKSNSTLKNKTSNTFDTFHSEESTGFKMIKKNNTNTIKQQGNSFMSQQFQQGEIQQKKAPLKPNPLKRKVNEPKQSMLQKQQGLVIQSKQYIDNKAAEEETTSINTIASYSATTNTTNATNTSKYSMTRLTKKQSSKHQDLSPNPLTKTIPKEPFSIKKSTSVNKKQPYQIDYKGTYYVQKDELSPLENPSAAIKEIIKFLPNDNDWNKQFDGLNLVRRFIKNHQQSFGLFYQNLPAIMPEVLKLVESLRSSLSKNAMITLSELCEALKKSMDPFLQTIFLRLFKKSQDANSFIVQQVRKCMTSLCHYCTLSKITTIIITNCQTKAIPVKLKVALCVDCILDRKDYDIQCLRQNAKLLGIMNILIGDGSAEVRNMIRESFQQICRNNPRNVVEDMFRKNCSKEGWEKFKKILDKEGKFMGL